MYTDLISHISADDSEGENETHIVALTLEHPDETFMNLVEELPEEEEEADEKDLQFTTVSTKGLRELRNLLKSRSTTICGQKQPCCNFSNLCDSTRSCTTGSSL
jgi:hypothetical protein